MANTRYALFIAGNPSPGPGQAAITTIQRDIAELRKSPDSFLRRAIPSSAETLARPSAIRAAIEDHRPTLLHVAGRCTPEGHIALYNEGRNDVLLMPPDDFADLLLAKQNENLRLVVLNTCFGFKVADSLNRRGIWCVAAEGMQDSKEAHTFARALYSALGEGATLREAVAEAARQIHPVHPNTTPEVKAPDSAPDLRLVQPTPRTPGVNISLSEGEADSTRMAPLPTPETASELRLVSDIEETADPESSTASFPHPHAFPPPNTRNPRWMDSATWAFVVGIGLPVCILVAIMYPFSKSISPTITLSTTGIAYARAPSPIVVVPLDNQKFTIKTEKLESRPLAPGDFVYMDWNTYARFRVERAVVEYWEGQDPKAELRVDGIMNLTGPMSVWEPYARIADDEQQVALVRVYPSKTLIGVRAWPEAGTPMFKHGTFWTGPVRALAAGNADGWTPGPGSRPPEYVGLVEENAQAREGDPDVLLRRPDNAAWVWPDDGVLTSLGRVDSKLVAVGAYLLDFQGDKSHAVPVFPSFDRDQVLAKRVFLPPWDTSSEPIPTVEAYLSVSSPEGGCGGCPSVGTRLVTEVVKGLFVLGLGQQHGLNFHSGNLAASAEAKVFDRHLRLFDVSDRGRTRYVDDLVVVSPGLTSSLAIRRCLGDPMRKSLGFLAAVSIPTSAHVEWQRPDPSAAKSLRDCVAALPVQNEWVREQYEDVAKWFEKEAVGCESVLCTGRCGPRVQL